MPVDVTELVRRTWLKILVNSLRPSVGYNENTEFLGTADTRRICTPLLVFLHETHCYLLGILKAARES